MIDGTFRWRRPVGRRALCESRPTVILPPLSKDATGWNFPAAPIQRGPHPLVARKRAFPPRRHPLPSTTTPRTNPASRGHDVTQLHQHRQKHEAPARILSPDGRRGQGLGSGRPRQVGDLARRHVHHRRHVAVTPRFFDILGPVTPSRLTWIGSAGEISPQRRFSNTPCRRCFDRRFAKPRRSLGVGISQTSLTTTRPTGASSTSTSRARWPKPPPLDSTAPRAIDQRHGPGGQDELGKPPQAGGGRALCMAVSAFPALQRRDRHDSGHSTADQRGTARRISPLLPGPSNLLRGGNSARRQEMLCAAANLVDRSSVGPRQRARQGSSASRDLCAADASRIITTKPPTNTCDPHADTTARPLTPSQSRRNFVSLQDPHQNGPDKGPVLRHRKRYMARFR